MDPAAPIVARAAAAACDAGDGFILDCPSAGLHERNRPTSWADGDVLFGWGATGVFEIRHDVSDVTYAARALEEYMNGLERRDVPIAVGWIAYDLGESVEPSAASAKPQLPEPLVRFAEYERYYRLRASGELLICDTGGATRRLSPDEVLPALAPRAASATPGAAQAGHAVSDFSPEGYASAVAKAREYILAGDIFEVNLSQRFTAPCPARADDLYMRLRSSNPAPYSALLVVPGGAVLSTSPELFLSVRGDRVVTRPIKGTARRGATPEADAAAARSLARSEKDRAELVMIVDLERNDLGRVCRFGSVRVSEPARVETFARVHHLVATVEGHLAPGASLGALIRATFPGGSITGAPKVRAMQIIDELEPCRRGVYTGAIGYVTRGRAEFNIAIRTAVLSKGAVSIHSGGAVTADSDPVREYDETLAKAEAVLEALGAPAPPD